MLGFKHKLRFGIVNSSAVFLKNTYLKVLKSMSLSSCSSGFFCLGKCSSYPGVLLHIPHGHSLSSRLSEFYSPLRVQLSFTSFQKTSSASQFLQNGTLILCIQNLRSPSSHSFCLIIVHLWGESSPCFIEYDLFENGVRHSLIFICTYTLGPASETQQELSRWLLGSLRKSRVMCVF